MQNHQVKRNTKRKKSVQVGRGGTRGKTSGHGHKGQKARAGGGPRPEIRDRIKKLPKLRGRGVNKNASVKQSFATVNLKQLQDNFKSGDRVTPQKLYDAGLIRKTRGNFPPIKVVATGELKDKLTLHRVAATAGAKEAIEKAGGEVK
jgi:large subunit ribosomal protein L15